MKNKEHKEMSLQDFLGKRFKVVIEMPEHSVVITRLSDNATANLYPIGDDATYLDITVRP